MQTISVKLIQSGFKPRMWPRGFPDGFKVSTGQYSQVSSVKTEVTSEERELGRDGHLRRGQANGMELGLRL